MGFEQLPRRASSNVEATVILSAVLLSLLFFRLHALIFPFLTCTKTEGFFVLVSPDLDILCTANTMASRPGIVLVHGAWHTPAHFANVVAKLETQGYQVQAPQSPSSNTVALDDVFALDVAAIKDSIRKITSAGKDAVVLMHSFGGVCGSEAVAEFLEEEKAGAYPSEHGTIIQLVYVCAVILPRNTSLLEDPNTQ